jgi:molecular chaperone GrpE
LNFQKELPVSEADLGAAGANPAPQPPLAEGEAPEGRVAELEAVAAAARAEADKLRDEFLRAKAEMENIRRRAQEDVAKAHRFGQENFASALLAVKDSLDAALATENASVESFKQGVEITAKQLESAFEKHAIKAVDPLGQKFDPHRHQAISQVEVADKEPGTVVTVLQKGYLLHDRVLRPALVIVSKAPESPSKA